MSVLHTIYFSAKGTTKTCAAYIGQHLGLETRTYDWLRCPCIDTLEISGKDVLLLAMPVYGGYIPHICTEMMGYLRGEQTPAILAAVYGNRHYDNALLQMKDILSRQGFVVIAAGAFLAQHSIFPSVAAQRPDEKDRAVMAEFAATCKDLLAGRDEEGWDEITLPGTAGYDASSFRGVPFRPGGDRTCISCGACAAICPCHAIDPANPRETDQNLCMSCGACIAACPAGARNYHGAAYKAAGLVFSQKCAAYRTPELFYAGKKEEK